MIKNYVLEDPILDWLNMYGKDKGFVSDPSQSQEFRRYLTEKRLNFETYIWQHISELVDNTQVIDKSFSIRDRVAQTLDAITKGVGVIFQPGIFGSIQTSTSSVPCYGVPDLLIRSDYLAQLFPEEELGDCQQGCKFHSNFHYRVADIKFIKLKYIKSTLGSQESRMLCNEKRFRIMKSYLVLYNQMLGELQERMPSKSYLIGKAATDFSSGTPPVPVTQRPAFSYGLIDPIHHDVPITQIAFRALQWIQELREQGSQWTLVPPSHSMLYPNMNNMEDAEPWVQTKKLLAKSISEITLLWNCGPSHRDSAHRNGVYQWDGCNSEILSINGKRGPIIDQIIHINRKDQAEVVVHPRRIKNRENIEILRPRCLEFIVDFETVQEIEDYHLLSSKEASSDTIFMIGCHMTYQINPQSFSQEFRNFVVQDLSQEEECRVMDEWIKYMEEMKTLYPMETAAPIFCWSKAEPVIYEHFRSRASRARSYPPLLFVDLLDVFKREPIVVRNAFSYSLKEIARSFYQHGLIETIWDNNIADGKDAMIQAWKWYQDKSPANYAIISQIERYNYIDCQVVVEIIAFLRTIC